jgi:hypothetical protein
MVLQLPELLLVLLVLEVPMVLLLLVLLLVLEVLMVLPLPELLLVLEVPMVRQLPELLLPLQLLELLGILVDLEVLSLPELQ